jgi:hypothetical protein
MQIKKWPRNHDKKAWVSQNKIKKSNLEKRYLAREMWQQQYKKNNG